MCKSKMATDIIQPTSPPPPPPKSNKQQPSKSPSSSTQTTTTTTSSSTSSRRSLASLRSSLPDNPHLYDISEIRHATNNFLAKNLCSTTTRSWRCTLHGKDVIIFQRKSQTKLLNPQTVRNKLSSICRSHHVAIVNLLGASISGEYIYLVYHFIRGASLYEALHNRNNPNFTVLSSWMSRVQIASDIANGLDYIHNSTGIDVTYVHNHVKSSSVIVTEEPLFGAKLCHFGVAELCGEPTEERESGVNGKIEEDLEVGTTSFRKLSRSNSVKFNGTRGYMSPEFQATGVGTRKSDVYAFGVILIGLLSGEGPVKYKLDKATKEYKKISAMDAAIAVVADDGGCGGEREGRIRKWVDRRLRDSYPVDVAEKLTRLAVDCVHVDPNKRPDMCRVAGKISKLYLESQAWCERMSVPTDFTVSFAPR
ncbi:hypothetical protein RND81_11G087700 [Saponaria officinalis]|uniref:Protein kinase domain-containing protein n=1 Tax=Saponaria officinalis TaxID=3572 RepID=A0AAW1HJK8_SAPOF